MGSGALLTCFTPCYYGLVQIHGGLGSRIAADGISERGAIGILVRSRLRRGWLVGSWDVDGLGDSGFF